MGNGSGKIEGSLVKLEKARFSVHAPLFFNFRFFHET